MLDIPIEVQLSSLPNNPGVYQFYDKDGNFLYVGKAKNLKKRVASYFTKNHEYGKTRVMVKKIVTIKHIVVASESDALLLENSLIKKHQPRYNVMLRDDKSYPWICIKNELFPRIFMTRNIVKDGSEYFGPYTSVKTVKTLMELIKNVQPLRTCRHKLTKEKIQQGKFKFDLEYHLGNCQGACQGEISEEEYQGRIEKVRQIIKGKFRDTLQSFKKEMLYESSQMNFEKAQIIKEKIEILEKYQAKSTVVNPKIDDVDVFSIIVDETHAYVNFLQVTNGLIVRSHTLEIQKKLNETKQQLLQLGIVELQQRFGSTSNEMYLPFPVSTNKNIKITIPKAGDKKKILTLSERNAQFYRQDRLKQIKVIDPDRHAKRIMAQMKADLRLSEAPKHIECFDNSNMQGSHPVAACVVFRNGKPSKKDYRHFNIKTVEGPNDFASMEEVVWRRYNRLLNEAESLPQLIVIDGGKGQLSAALKSLELLGLRGKIAIIGIAKRLEEIYFPEDPIPLYLDKKSETLKIIQQLRNEAHRFGITFHRNKRSKAAINSELESIEGIGAQTARQLLKNFKSVKRIREASIESLAKSIGMAKAKKVYESFH
ncbi:MAG: excinuclease ABC subunit UvrC [Bacteroidota bacterium]